MLPIILDLTGRKALVVGGGRIAYRKAKALADEGAHVTVISPDFVDDFSSMPNSNLVQRTFEPGDTHGYQLVITATGDHAVVYSNGAVRDLRIPAVGRQQCFAAASGAGHRPAFLWRIVYQLFCRHPVGCAFLQTHGRQRIPCQLLHAGAGLAQPFEPGQHGWTDGDTRGVPVVVGGGIPAQPPARHHRMVLAGALYQHGNCRVESAADDIRARQW